MTNSNISNLYNTVSETYNTMTEGPNNVGSAVRTGALAIGAGIGAVVMALSPLDAEAQPREYSLEAPQQKMYDNNPLNSEGVLDRNTEFAKPPYAPQGRRAPTNETYVETNSGHNEPVNTPIPTEGLALLGIAGAGYAIRQLTKEN